MLAVVWLRGRGAARLSRLPHALLWFWLLPLLLSVPAFYSS